MRIFLGWQDLIALANIVGHPALLGAQYEGSKLQQARIQAIRRMIVNELRPLASLKAQKHEHKHPYAKS